MDGDNYALLRRAITELKQVTAHYHGYHREFCPHLIGASEDVGRVLVWQFAGDSESGLPSGGGWRCFDVDDLENLQLRDGEWHRGYEKGEREQHCVESIDVSVDPAHKAEIR